MAESSRESSAETTEGEPIRFAFVVNNYPPRVGGVELHVRSLATRLRELGYAVTVVTLAEESGTAYEHGIEVIRLSEHLRIAGVLGFPSIGATRRIARILDQRGVDVVSVHTRFFPMSWVGLRAARHGRAVVIHTEHGSDHVVSDSAVIRVASRVVDGTIGRYILRQATEVLGVSDRVVAFVRRLSGRVDARVFYNAIDPAQGIDRARRNHVVFVGRLVPGKGADVFIHALSALAREGRAFTAEILGDGPSFEELERLVSQTGLGDRVTMRGRVSVQEVSEALAGAVLVNPSTLAEGFQTTLLEALEAGGCVVSYDVPGADLLRSQGFPVDIVGRREVAAIAGAIGSRLDAPWPVLSMRDWYWSTRAREYARLAQDIVSRHRGD